MSRRALLTEVSAMTDLAVRAATPADRAAVIAMHKRCSAHSIRRRWHGPRHDIPEPYLTQALAGLPTHIALLALDGPRVVALASAIQQDGGEWEIGASPSSPTPTPRQSRPSSTCRCIQRLDHFDDLPGDRRYRDTADGGAITCVPL